MVFLALISDIEYIIITPPVDFYLHFVEKKKLFELWIISYLQLRETHALIIIYIERY